MTRADRIVIWLATLIMLSSLWAPSQTLKLWLISGGFGLGSVWIGVVLYASRHDEDRYLCAKHGDPQPCLSCEMGAEMAKPLPDMTGRDGNLHSPICRCRWCK